MEEEELDMEDYIINEIYNEQFDNEEEDVDTKKKGKEIERMLNGYLIFLRKKRDEQNKITKPNI